ncbi:hypothetical protein M1C57_14280 [Rhodococcus pyridinivorans]|uniref:hypothetical protein n=1 Tax=Rhodococcus pyridinivorans TaxID=103816 RepID=UPI00200B7FCA|nr:hypothetical protein [Rhodococcus pyridinivorans]UPW02871.1 hypothetical protein M1C57_14280 [Rhodococcus pyridinivorans]
MKLFSRDAKPEVRVEAEATRPIVLRICGLHFAFHCYEARRLADALHDAADQVNDQSARQG